MSSESPAPALERRLGPVDAAAIVISNVIGVGIFTTPGIIAQMAPHPAAMIGVWVAGGLLAFAGAMAYAELAALRPRAGGEYVYLREAFGPLAAFLTGWTSFVAGFSGAIAAGAVGAAAYVGRFVPAAGDTTPLFVIPVPVVPLTVSRQTIVALVAIGALTALHIRGLGPGRLVQNALAGIKVAALMLLIALGFAAGQGSLGHFSAGTTVAPASWALAMIPVMFSYSGWNAATYVAEEVREPSRNVPLALAWGTGAVVLIYVLINLLYLYALPIDQFAGSIRVVDIVAERLLGPVAGAVLGALTVVIVMGSLSAMVFAGPRVYYAMARDGLFFRAAGRVHSRFRTPAVAIAAQSVWSGLLVLSGTFEQLLTYTGFAVILFAGVAVSAVFVLRWKHPHEPRPFKAWGYPVAPAVFVLASLAILLSAIRGRPGPSRVGLLIIAAGVPVYWAMTRRRRA